MKRSIATLAIAVAMSATISLNPSTVRGENPPYVFLQPSTTGYGYPVVRQPYAYGWFGACPQPFFTFHWSYYNERWIWR